MGPGHKARDDSFGCFGRVVRIGLAWVPAFAGMTKGRCVDGATGEGIPARCDGADPFGAGAGFAGAAAAEVEPGAPGKAGGGGEGRELAVTGPHVPVMAQRCDLGRRFAQLLQELCDLGSRLGYAQGVE